MNVGSGLLINVRITEWRTAVVGRSTYPADVATVILLADGFTHVTYTSPDLILTLLEPGEVMFQVRT